MDSNLKKTDKKRIDYLDTLRLLACLLVLFAHSMIQSDDPSLRPMLAIIGVTGSPSSELFLAISGALLIPVRQRAREFYVRRFSKLMIPLIVWSFGIIILQYLRGSASLSDCLLSVLYLPVKPSDAVYWFMYVLVGLYLFAPILSKWLISASKKEIQFYLFLWGATLCMPAINFFLPSDLSTRDPIYDCFAPFSGFIGYMLLGYYCVHYPIIIKSKLKAVALFLLCQMMLYSALFVFQMKFDSFIIVDNLSIFSAVEVFLIITLMYNINDIFRPVQHYFAAITKYLFGIYLMHILVLNTIVRPLFGGYLFNPILQTVCMAFILFVLCLIFTYLLSKLPKSKYFIGV